VKSPAQGSQSPGRDSNGLLGGPFLSVVAASFGGMTINQVMITIDCAEPRALARFWTAALGTTVAQDHGGEFLVLAPPPAGGLPLGLQRVPEPRAGKNRVHVDFHGDDRGAEVKRLVELGAKEVGEHSVPGLAWTVLTDPEGNEFCVSG